MKRHLVNPSKKLLAALGTMSDFKVAATFGVRPFQVKLLREKEGIPAVASSVEVHHFQWTPEAERLLGSMPDTVLAKRLDTSSAIVNGRRAALDISAFERPLVEISPLIIQNPHDWTAEEDALLGTDYDTVIADLVGINKDQVTYRRNRLGIDPYRRGTRIQWTQQMLDNLGEISDGDFAEYFEICKLSVYIKRILLSIPTFNTLDFPSPPNIPRAAVKFLGKKYDVELAEEFSVNRLNIRVNRLIRGIAPLDRVPNELQFSWTTEMDALLGLKSDKEVGKELGISGKVVQYRRRKLGVEPAMRSSLLVWNQQMISELGRSKDQILSQVWQCDVNLVREKREELGLSEHLEARVWLESEIALLGTLSDPQTAKKLGISATAVRNKRNKMNIKPLISHKKFIWTKRRLALLGTMADERLAYQLTVTSNVVSKKRVQLNIPIWKSPHKGTWADPEALVKLGTMSDPDLAKLLGNTAPAVFRKRKQLGIPAYVAQD